MGLYHRFFEIRKTVRGSSFDHHEWVKSKSYVVSFRILLRGNRQQSLTAAHRRNKNKTGLIHFCGRAHRMFQNHVDFDDFSTLNRKRSTKRRWSDRDRRPSNDSTCKAKITHSVYATRFEPLLHVASPHWSLLSHHALPSPFGIRTLEGRSPHNRRLISSA